MDNGQYAHDPTRSAKDTDDKFRPGIHPFQFPQCHSHKTQVQQVITHQQYPVDEVGEAFIAMQQAQDKQFAIAVEDKANMNGYYVSDEQVEYVREGIHNLCFGVNVSFSFTKVVIVLNFQNILKYKSSPLLGVMTP
jgi:hypothetical protein